MHERLDQGPLRILQLASHGDLQRGGAVQMVLLARGLRERGHHVATVWQHPPGAPDAAFAAIEDLAPRFFHVAGWRDLPRFRAFLRRERFDVIHSHRDPALRFAYLAATGLPVPAFVTQRGTVYAPPRWGFAGRAFRSRRLDRVIAVAEAVRRVLVERGGLAPDKVSVVYGGFDPARFHRGVSGEGVRREFGLNGATPVVGIIGALIAKKGHADFFAAAARIARALPEARFLVVGRGKPSRFADSLAQLGLADRVLFTGHRAEIAELLAAMSVLVCASVKGEGLTGTLREAMAVGTPVVTTDVAGNAELVRHEETGLLVPVGDPDALAAAVLRLVRRPEEAARFRDAADALIHRLCDNGRRCERIEAIYREIIDRKAAGAQP